VIKYEEISKIELRNSLVNDDIVHLATHADFDQAQLGHNSAFIVLDSANYFEDNFDSINPKAYFTIGDVRLCPSLNSTLVVLSACNSGMGKTMTNSFSVNFPAVLVANGTKCVLASFWEVSDEFAGVYFNQFYKELIQFLDPTIAFENTRKYFRDIDTRPELTYSFDLILK
jgi:CHAT domain-containing protein